MLTSTSTEQLVAVDFDPFAGPAIRYLIPTTEPQREIWLACRFGGDEANRSYNESITLRFTGRLDPAAFERAWQSLVQRHESLRSAFSADGEQMLVFGDLSIPLVQLDWTGRPATEQEQAIADYLSQDANIAFDLTNGPLVKGGLIKRTDTNYHFVLTAHHLICDGWSVGILMQDLGALYSAYARHQPPNLPEAARFSLYADEQRAFADSADYRQIEQFWLGQYAGPIPVLNLPVNFQRPARRTFQSKRLDFRLDDALARAVRQVGAGVGSSFVTTCVAAMEVLLHRLTGQTDLVLGLPAAGQSVTGHDRLVGHCVNLLPLRSFPRPDLSFIDYLKQRRIELLDAFDHQQLTFGSLLKKLPIPRDPSRLPLVPVVFNMDMGLADGVAFHDLAYAFDSNPRAFENFELSINATGSGGALQLEWSYNTQLFREETIRQFHQQFVALLEEIAATPNTRLGGPARPAPAAEPTRLGIGRTLLFATERALHDHLGNTARRFPDKVAVRFGRQTLTYSALNERANQLARLLVEQGVRPGDRVGLAVERSLELIVCLLAVMKTGAAYIPVDPRHPADRIAFVLTDAGCRLLLTNRPHEGKFTESLPEVLLEAVWPGLSNYAADDLPIRVAGDDPIYVLYTSGTTGRPKGVQIKHNSVVNVMLSVQQQPGLSPADKTVSLATIAFDLATVEIYLPLLTGAELVLVDSDTSRNGPALAALLRAEGITFIQATPATWRMLLESGWQGTSDLRIISCAEALSKDLAEKLLRSCGELWNFYGPTETTIYATGKQIRPDDERITIGSPIANTQLTIQPGVDSPGRSAGAVDSPGRNGGPVDAPGVDAPGVDSPGEICISGLGVGIGYLNRPELTAEKFVTDPVSGASMYRTGDLGRLLPNGEVQYLGRIDQQIKIRGHRIEPAEIEFHLLRQADIQDAVVIAREDRPGDQRLVAYVVADAAATNGKTAGWRERWNVIYDMGIRHEAGVDAAEQNLDVAIAEQISDAKDIRQQADDWLAQSVRRIQALNAARIMEVGCGAGQLLFALAPAAQRYIATDYAPLAIENLSQKLRRQPDPWTHVSVKTAMADDFSAVVPASLDLVLIHSVAQYFPDVQYFLRVLERAVEATAAGGCVFVGDMQGKNTLRMHHAFDQLVRTAGEKSVDEFRKTVDRRVQFDDEFLADPAFFYQLPQRIPRIAGVNVQLREGSYRNETTKYHYDVWLYVGQAPTAVAADQVIDWRPDLTLSAIEQRLTQDPLHTHQIRNVVNNRTAKDYALLQLLDNVDPQTPVAAVQARIDSVDDGVDPTVFWALGAKHGFQTHLRWSDDGTDNRLDVVFIPNTQLNAIPEKPAGLVGPADNLTEYAKNPYKPAPVRSPEQVRQWKQQAALVLPDYMVPSDFVVLAELPLTPNGKIDRKALPRPEPPADLRPDSTTEPRNETEKLLAAIWADALGLANVSTQDSFFELGGHSMLAVQVMTRLEKETGKRLPLSTLFAYPTIEKLAQLLQPDKPAMTWKSLVPIKPQGGKTPIYIIHGIGLNLLNFSSLVTYMDPDQPIYGLQARGLDGTEEPLNRMEDIAACYIQEILDQNPTGPYAIAGYSFGGYVAYEMAQQLTAMGKEMKMLAMFDTDARALMLHRTRLSRLAWRIGRQFPKLLFIGKSLLKHPAETVRYQRAYLNDKLQHLLRAVGLRDIPGSEGELGHMNYIMAKHEEAFYAYDLRPYNGKLDLFRAMTRLYFVEDQVYLGWKEYALGGVRVHDVPGDHGTLMLPPNDKALALALQQALDHS